MTTAPASTALSWIGPGRDDAARDAPTLVVLHGYGSSEAQMIALSPLLGMFLGRSARVIAVRGEYPAPGRRGFSWYPGDRYSQPPDADIAAVADRVAAAVQEHSDRAVWLGFSQGMCTAITVLRRRPELVSALVALSGFSFDAPQPGDPQLARDAAAGRGVPCFYGRDPTDPAIPGFAAEWARRFLADHTALEEHSYPGMGHSLSPVEIADVVPFLRQHLAS
ncbi:alpha/beta hydrolase [Nakamurella alba]|uniref:alpha/beta hydrolase n=1 Tax=Nakamurella alba TaxID=2665158 RepID=UPI0018ABED16|nr:hypothetical protein [Nakamurella alba]